MPSEHSCLKPALIAVPASGQVLTPHHHSTEVRKQWWPVAEAIRELWASALEQPDLYILQFFDMGVT